MSVLAGHFAWNVWKSLPTFQTSTLSQHSRDNFNNQFKVSCFVMGRNPVDRVVSYFYQRCFREASCAYFNRTINDLSIDELIDVIMFFRQASEAIDDTTKEKYLVAVDDGMSDAACRALADRRLTAGIHIRIGDELSHIKPQPLGPEETELALHNIEHCVVGILEDYPNSLRVIEHWFPWMNLAMSLKREMFLFHRNENSETLLPSHKAVIQDLNQCDMKLHHKIVKQFNSQLMYMDILNA